MPPKSVAELNQLEIDHYPDTDVCTGYCSGI